MSDVSQTTTTAQPEALLTNTAEARTTDGTLKDQSATSSTTEKSSTEPEVKVDDTTKPTVPEKYADFTAPKDFQLDAKLVEAATPIFKELGLTQDQAQKLVDWYSQTQIANTKAMDETVNTMRAGWRTQVEKDFSGNLDGVKADIGKMLTAVDEKGNRLISPQLEKDFRAQADLTGSGDHPATIKVLSILAKQINEGTHVEGRGPSPHGQQRNGVDQKPTPAQSMYPNLPTSQR
jgi:antitoxin component of RelBE/YafQ-DinJ toxin-antitoxin module